MDIQVFNNVDGKPFLRFKGNAYDLFKSFEKTVNKSFNKKIIKVAEKNRLLKNFKDSIQGYTYYEN